MIPVNFGNVCGWYHPSSSATTVVIICGSIGFEALMLHRPVRMFADLLTDYNVGVLRFDYPGTGDAAGEDSDPKQLEAWLLTVMTAFDWVKSEIAPKEIVLCGIHLGALLAAKAAGSLTEVVRLILLAPITSGYTYVRAQRMLATISAELPGSIIDDYLDLIGQRLHSTTVTALSELDIVRSQNRLPPEILLVVPEGAVTEMVERAFRTMGARVTRKSFTGYRGLMREAHVNEVPFETFKQVGSWLDERAQSYGTLRLPSSSGKIEVDECSERRLKFESVRKDCLIGVICEPVGRTSTLNLIIINTGGEPHYGSTRFAVMLSRLMAPHGVTTLRFDLAGLGDSNLEGDDHRPHAYYDRTPEIRAAIEQMPSIDDKPMVLFGVCSGAYHAMRAGVDDPRVSGLILINQEVFDWNHSKAILLLRRAGRLLVRFRAQMSRRETARNPRNDLSDLAAQGWRSHISRVLVELDALPSRVLRYGPLERLLRMSVSKSMQVLYLTGDREASSLNLLHAHLGRGNRRLQKFPNVKFKIVKGLDHGLNSRIAYESLVPVVEDALLSMSSKHRVLDDNQLA